jgi:hypothetical protein
MVLLLVDCGAIHAKHQRSQITSVVRCLSIIKTEPLRFAFPRRTSVARTDTASSGTIGEVILAGIPHGRFPRLSGIGRKNATLSGHCRVR